MSAVELTNHAFDDQIEFSRRSQPFLLPRQWQKGGIRILLDRVDHPNQAPEPDGLEFAHFYEFIVRAFFRKEEKTEKIWIHPRDPAFKWESFSDFFLVLKVILVFISQTILGELFLVV